MANTQPLTDPVAVNRDPVNNIGNDGVDMRWAMGALSAPSTGSTFGHRSGVFPGGTGSSGYADDCQVLAASGMSVTVSGGHYAVDRSPYGLYVGAITGTVTVTHGVSNPSLPRIDYVVLRLRDPGLDTGVTETAKIVILVGSPGSVPVEPSAQLTSGDMVLAAVRIRANTSSVVASDITDKRSWIAARGGIAPRRFGDLSAGSYEGEYADDIVSRLLLRWSGSSWEPVASPAVWTQWTPGLFSVGTGSIFIGTGAQYIGRYQLIGKRLDFTYFWKWGTSPYNGGYGPVYSKLPTHPVTGAQLYCGPYDQWVQAHLWVNTAEYVGDFLGQTLCWAGTSTLQPYFMINSISNSNTSKYQIAATQGVTTGTSSVPNIFNPNGFPEGGNLHISGSMEVTF